MKTNISEKICRTTLLLCACVPALISCDRLNDEAGERKKTAISFSAGELEPWGAETLVRGASSEPRLVETVDVALEGNWVLSASLIEEAAPPTRATTELADGAVVRVVALTTADPAVVADEKDYVYSQSDNSFTWGDDGPLIVEEGSYHFMVYSYNTTDVVGNEAKVPRGTAPAVMLNPYGGTDAIRGNDLIMGKTTAATTVSAAAGLVLPSLKHQFSRVKYNTPTVDVGTTLTNVSVSLSNNYRAKLTKSTVVLEQDAMTTEQVLSSGSDETNYSIVYTAGHPPVLNLSGTIGSKTFSGMTVPYKTGLEPGRSYILWIEIKRGLPWAGSNIYWEENLYPERETGKKGGLTFKEAGYVGIENKYQGVFFRWGSLVGIDPCPSASNGTAWSSSSNLLYVPDYSSGTWSVLENASWGGSNIPYIDNITTAGPKGKNVDYFGSLSADSTKALYRKKLGDICRYLSEIGAVRGSYRLPVLNELLYGHKDGGDGNSKNTISYSNSDWNTGVAAEDKWRRMGSSSWSSMSTTQTRRDGQYGGLTNGGHYSNYTNFPAMGQRTDGGVLTGVNSVGNYGCNSPYSNTYAYFLRLQATGGIDDQNGPGNYSCSLRCLLDDPYD